VNRHAGEKKTSFFRTPAPSPVSFADLILYLEKLAFTKRVKACQRVEFVMLRLFHLPVRKAQAT
jgi:hypothetical protein